MLAGGSGITPMYQVHISFTFGLLIFVPQRTIVWIALIVVMDIHAFVALLRLLEPY